MLKRDTRRQADTRSPVANNIQIVGFYSGTEPDHRGRYVHEIQAWPDEQLEAVHDYIQWLFPLRERSAFNVAAPVLNPESIQEFRTRPDLRGNLRASFLRMMNFYGFEVRSGEHIGVSRAPNFEAKATGWLSPGNHNHLRITRILRCLTVLGLEAEAKAFFDCLSKIYEDEQNRPMPAISDETMLYWREAVGGAGQK
jgi:Opioid growth factor receptor (OGFr) conserved region